MTLTFGSLFAGIGGIDLGLERAGMRCAWQVEIDDYATRVLAKHWPNVPRHRDVRECGAHNLAAVDVIAGGFPCQDISENGPRSGMGGDRSGPMWREFARIIRELRPRYVLVENVTGLLHRGIDRVLGDLAESGYDAEWSTLSACALGAPHMRERVFIVAYAGGLRRQAGRSAIGRKAPSQGSLDQPYRQGATSRWPGATITRPVGVAYGIPNRVDRLRGLGNAVVPQVAEWIGRQIQEHHHA